MSGAPAAPGPSAVPTRVLLPGLARLLRSAAERKGLFALAVGGGIVFAILQIITSQIIGRTTEEVVLPAFAAGTTPWGALMVAGLAILGIAVARAVAVAVRRTVTNALIFDLHREYRERLVAVHARLPLLWHRRQSTGTLLSNLQADIEATFFSMMAFPFALSTLVMLAYASVLVARVDPYVLLVLLALSLGLIGLNVLLQRQATPVVVESQRLRAKVAEIAHESFDGAHVVKSLGREDLEEARFREAAQQLRHNGIRFGYVRGWFDPLIELLPSLGILVVVLLGAWRVGAGAITTGDVVQIAYLFTLMGLPIRSFGWVLGDLSRSVVGWGRVQRVLQASDHLPHGTAELPPGPGRLELRDVEVTYRDHEVDVLAPRLATAPAGTTGDADADAEAFTAPEPTHSLHGVSLTVDPAAGRRVVAVVGPTGSGKSTLAQVAARLFDPDTGQVLLDGTPLRDLSAEALTRGVALVLQQAFVLDTTVRENITLGEERSEEEIRRALRIAQADGFVDALPQGLDTPLGERGGTLSGGQRQRLALARAIVRRPRLLILDDATSAVDPAVEEAILAQLRRELTDTALLLVAYRKSTIALADHVVLLEHGRVTAQGTHAQLRQDVPAYRALVDAYDEAAIADGLLEAAGEEER
ncbi:ABC transporter ATP-binding protein [Brachybacterium sillae]|uniref:ABC transporter ATP-binding protein n=1 Tax=Brachybacterium sillae TaxID=2810536 RepID=UPI00217E4FE1|nr:ABC transporter ATP-binding protein [Brachybacterium sillae]